MSTASAKPFKMSDTALKFGPEWLRALSHGDTSSSPPPSPGPITQRYKLADYRYGREEMLALFDKTVKAPDELALMAPLYVEKTMTPLAFVQMAEEELRLWQQGINSDVVLKLMGRGSGVAGGTGSSGPAGRGRGGSMDRGRGRARGGGGGNLRGVSYDEDGEHRPGTNSFGRGGPRPFERSQSNSERPWPERAERNGNEEWNGPASPKKEFGRPYQDNWRSREAKERERERERAEHKEDDDGWRTAGRSDRWARPGWRGDRDAGEEKGSRFFPKGDREGGSDEGGRRPRIREDDPRQGGNFYVGKRSSARPESDVLPEWASEELHEGGVGGTFDSSGAFRGETWSEDEEQAGPKEPLVDKNESLQPQHEESLPAAAESASEARKSPVKEPVVEADSTFVGNAAEKPAESVFLSKDVGEVSPAEDDLQHAQAVASTLVAQLVEDEDLAGPNQHMPERWLYRDPQGHVQGPFEAAEMAEWFNSGYFTMALSVKRTTDERFVQLGEFTKLCGGRLPFLPGPTIPPLKADAPTLSTEQEKLQLLHQQVLQQQLFQQQLMQQQLMLRQQEMQATLAKLSQMDGWSGLSAAQQQQILNHHLMTSPVTGVVGTDRLLQQLRAQMEAQAKLQSDMLQRKDPMQAIGVPVSHHGKPDHDPIQSFMEQLLVHPKPVAIQKPVVPAAPSKEADPIQSFLQQMQWGRGAADLNGQDPAGNQAAPGFQGLVPGQGLVPWPPQQSTNHTHFALADEPSPLVWDMDSNAKAEEKKRLLEQQQQLELQRRQEEEERRAKEEERRMKEEEERKRREEERRVKEEEEQQKRREEEEKKRLEEEKRKREEENRKKEEEKRKKQEEKRKREEEELRQQQAEEERIRREEEKLAEQQRRQQEAWQRLQELQAAANKEKEKAKAAAAKAAKSQAPAVAPWAQQQKQQQQQATDTLSLSEIQKLQEEKEKQQRIAEALRAEQIANLNAAAAAAAAQQKAITLRWAQQQSQESHTKSLAEIQAEEAAQLAKLKEKERAERAAQQAALNLTSARGWGSNHLGSAWSSGRSAAATVAQSPPQWSAKSSSSTNAVGFWDEPVAASPKAQQPAKVAKPSAPAPASPVKSAAPAATSSGKKNRANKEEETIKKLFEQKMDAFSQWCHDYLGKIEAQLDIATFVSFLKDVESPYDVQDYVKSYLGDGKEAKEFAKQFLERRSRWRQSQRGSYAEEDNMCLPARAVNPGHAQEFHEVKSKSKKSKKKMQKVDASLLGFSVTASSDRVNVGERDYGDGL